MSLRRIYAGLKALQWVNQVMIAGLVRLLGRLKTSVVRAPDLVIGEKYLCRWYVLPRNRFFNIYLHKFLASDDDRALHDHPWYSVSFLLKGELLEHNLKHARTIPRFLPVVRSAKFAHRLELVKGPVWTLFITGPTMREWGFFCAHGWRHWTQFTTKEGNKIGKGCD